jgi:dihydrolipoamide dehydrogenase
MYSHAKKDFATHGIKVDGEISIDVAKMMENKGKAVSGLTGGIEYLLKKYKVGSSFFLSGSFTYMSFYFYFVG